MILMANADPRAALITSMIKRNGLSVNWLAKRIGVNHVSVGAWLDCSAKPRDEGVWNSMIAAIGDYERSTRTEPDGIQLERVGLRKIIVYPGLSAGVMTSVESDTSSLTVKDWGTDRERWGRVIDGYSMSTGDERGLEPGDIAIFEARPWEPYHVVHAYDNGEDTVKVARGFGASVELVPINPDYPILSGKTANIKGVLVGRIRKGPNDEVTTTEYPHGMRYRILKTNDQKI
jgi:hypothetical protein